MKSLTATFCCTREKTMSNLFHRAQKAMQKRRSISKDNVQYALSGITPKMAGLMFDLSQGQSGTTLDDNRRAHVKAIELVSSLLGSFSLPVRPRLEYHGMIKNATDNNGNISDGVIRVGAVLHTLMGHKVHIEIPVIVKGRNLMEPAVFFYDDAPYVMCGPALDDLIKRGSLQRNTQSRYIYSPPTDRVQDQNNVPREGITNLEHMFAPGVRNPYNFRRQYSKTAQTDEVYLIEAEGMTQGICMETPPSDWYGTVTPISSKDIENVMAKDPGLMVWDTVEDMYDDLGEEPNPRRNAQHKGTPRKRTNIDTPTEFPELWTGDVEDEMLDPAERCREELYGIGAEVVLNEDVQARERGGGHLIVPKGEHGKVLKDMEGDGKILYVNFPDMSLTMSLPKRMLRNAAMTRIAQTGEPEYVEEAFMMRTYNDIYYPGVSASLQIADGLEDGETNNVDGMAYYQTAENSWQPWGNNEGSRSVAERLNQEGWVASILPDAMNIEDSNLSWRKMGSKRAATIDQVKNEVKIMLREGYSKVDIKDTIQRRYPEHMEDALSSFDKNADTLVPVSVLITYKQDIKQKIAFEQVKKMLSNNSQLVGSKIGSVKATSKPTLEQDYFFITAEIGVDSASINNMLVGDYLEEQQDGVGFSLEAPGF